MCRTVALTLALVVLASSGCAYKEFYRQTAGGPAAPPVPPEAVKVVKSKDDLVSAWTQVGTFRGHAPTVKEAIAAAQRNCGQHGADLYVLNVEPFLSDNVYKVDGICGLFTESARDPKPASAKP